MMNGYRIVGLIVGSVLVLAAGSNSDATGTDGGVRFWDPSLWGHDYIDDTRDVGFDISVAIDPDTDETYISYYDRDGGDLWLARTGAPTGNCGPFNTWDCKVVDSAGVVGKHSSIAVGGSGRMATLYISYYDEDNGSLKVLEGSVDRETGVLSYTTETIQQGSPGGSVFVGTRTALAIDGWGYAHIAYRVEYSAAQAVKYAKRVASGTGNCGAGAPAGDWECGNVHLDVGIGEHLDIDTNPTGVPSIAFFDAHDTEAYPVVATRVASGGSCNLSDVWECAALEWTGVDAGELVSIAVAEYQTFLAFYSESYQSLIYAVWPGFYTNCGSYDCYLVYPMGPDVSQSAIDIALEGDSTPVVVYQHVGASSTDLMIAREADSDQNCVAGFGWDYAWRCTTLNEGDATHFQAVGGLSIAMNAFGEATVANREVYRPPFSLGEGRLELAVAPRADRTPDPFVFVDQTGTPLSTVITSDPIVVSGIDNWSSISITGCTGPPCEYSVNGGAWYDEARWVNEGDSVEVRLTSAPTYGTTTDLTLNTGRAFDGTRDTFTVTSLVQHTLSVALAGDGDGSVTSAPPGIDCPSSACSALFDETETVILSHAASAGSHFSGWSGDADCADGMVDTNTDVSCVATFLLDTHTVTISKAGTGSGTVVSVPAGINCGATCVASFDTGIQVTLIPSSDGGSTFSGWSGDADCADGIITMNADVSCTASFWLDADIIFFDGFESGNLNNWSLKTH
jgi:Divergent InlB B-repeat domain